MMGSVGEKTRFEEPGMFQEHHRRLVRRRRGIDYGGGIMQMDFVKYFFLLKGYPQPEGHIGIIATMLIYDPEHDLNIVINFGDT